MEKTPIEAAVDDSRFAIRDSRPLLVRALGRQPYEPVWRAMQAFTDARGPETPDELWMVEHDPVFTLGQAGRWEHVLVPGEIPVVPVDRGGQVTYHGPGQIVAYPLLDLRRLGIGVREFVHRIEQAIIDTLGELEHRRGAPRGCARASTSPMPRSQRSGSARPPRLHVPWPRLQRQHGSGALQPHQSVRLSRVCR